MKLYCFYLVSAFFIFLNHSAIGQVNHEKLVIDTIHQTIIYEYDTVYVAPDTVKLTDTIVHYQSQKKQISSKHNGRFFDKLVFDNISDSWSAGVGVASFAAGFLNKGTVVDSFTTRRLMNISFELHVNYEVNHFKYTLGIGFTPLHEQLQCKEKKYIVSPISTTGSFDSLLVNNNCVTDNYFNYLNVFFNVGPKWGNVKRGIFVNLTACISADFLINYKALFPINEPIGIMGSSVRKVGLKIGIYPSVGYKLWGKMNLSLGPFCNYSLLNNQKYPGSDRLIFGVGLRIQ